MNPVRRVFCDNFDERAGGVKPSLLILHYTGTTTGQDAEDYYTNIKIDAKAGKISPHYMIDTDGAVTQFVGEQKRAWHAGRAWWDGQRDINSHSIGIELVNGGHLNSYSDFPQQQMDALAALARDILTRHAIPSHNILGHSDIVPARTEDRWKPDPGERLRWDWLAGQGIGLWPQPEQNDYDQAAVLYKDEPALRQAFTAYGYDPHCALDDVVRAFQRHFQPEAHFEGRDGKTDPHTAAKLHWLLRAKAVYKP